MNKYTKLCSIYGIGNHTTITKNAVSRWRTLENLPKVFRELKRRSAPIFGEETVNELKKNVRSSFLGYPLLNSMTPQLTNKALGLAKNKTLDSPLVKYVDKNYYERFKHKLAPHRPPKEFGTTTFDPDSLENKNDLHLYRGVTGHEKTTDAQGLAFGGGYFPGAVHGGPAMDSVKNYGERLPGGNLVAIYKANPKGQNFTADWGIENMLKNPQKAQEKPTFIRDRQDFNHEVAYGNRSNLYETLLTPKHNELVGFGVKPYSSSGEDMIRMIPASDEKGVSSLIRNLLHKRRNSKMTVADTFPGLKTEFGSSIPTPLAKTNVYPNQLEADMMSDNPNWRLTTYPKLRSQLAQHRADRFVERPFPVSTSQ